MSIEFSDLPPVPRTWPEVLRRAQNALEYWDRYCPDDGRPALALKRAIEYHDDPTPERCKAMTDAGDQLARAVEMAYQAMPKQQPNETKQESYRRMASAEHLAWGGARVVGMLIAGLWSDTLSTRLHYWGELLESCFGLRMFDMVFNNNWPKDGDDDE